MNTIICRGVAVSIVFIAGCQGSFALIPNNDPALRKSPTAFAADAAKRDYEDNAPKIPDAEFRADYALMLRQVELANISSEDWTNVEVWINGRYVLFCPKFAAKSDKTLPFSLFFDGRGRAFDTQSGKNPIQSIEIYRDGAMYTVTSHVADLERDTL